MKLNSITLFGQDALDEPFLRFGQDPVQGWRRVGDAILTHLIDTEDIIIASRNTYGGTYQLLVDLFAKKNKQRVALEWFDGYTGEAFAETLKDMQYKHRVAIEKGRRIHVYVESPCNPHGYVLDVPGTAAPHTS